MAPQLEWPATEWYRRVGSHPCLRPKESNPDGRMSNYPIFHHVSQKFLQRQSHQTDWTQNRLGEMFKM